MIRLAISISILLLAGCSTHYMAKDELIAQFGVAQDSIEITNATRAGYYRMKNGLGEHIVTADQLNGTEAQLVAKNGKVVLRGFRSGERIGVTNKSGEKVKIKVDLNSQFIINRGKENMFQTYLVGTYLADSLIYGYRSRILGTMRFLELKDVNTVEVYSEFKFEEK